MSNLERSLIEWEMCSKVDRDELILKLLDKRLTQNLYYYFDQIDKQAKKVMSVIGYSDSIKNIIRYDKGITKVERHKGAKCSGDDK